MFILLNSLDQFLKLFCDSLDHSDNLCEDTKPSPHFNHSVGFSEENTSMNGVFFPLKKDLILIYKEAVSTQFQRIAHNNLWGEKCDFNCLVSLFIYFSLNSVFCPFWSYQLRTDLIFTKFKLEISTKKNVGSLKANLKEICKTTPGFRIGRCNEK